MHWLLDVRPDLAFVQECEPSTTNHKADVTEPDERGVYHVDEAYAWLEQDSSIMFKAATKHGDPLELTARDARALAEVLLKLAKILERINE